MTQSGHNSVPPEVAADVAADTWTSLTRLVQEMGRPVNTVLILAIAALERDLTKAKSPTAPATGSRSSAAPRPRKALSNGPHTFEVIECSPPADKSIAQVPVTLLHLGRNEHFSIYLSRPTLALMIAHHCKRLNIAPFANGEDFIGSHVTLICYAGAPFKLPSGELLNS